MQEDEGMHARMKDDGAAAACVRLEGGYMLLQCVVCGVRCGFVICE